MKLFIPCIFAIALALPANKSFAILFTKPDTALVSPFASVSKYMKTSEFIKLSRSDFNAITGKKTKLF